MILYDNHELRYSDNNIDISKWKIYINKYQSILNYTILIVNIYIEWRKNYNDLV